MDKQNNLNQLLSAKLAADISGIAPPPLNAMQAAREVVKQRHMPEPEREDIFSLLAAFLNMKIKLYHAVIASIIIACGIMLYTGKKENTRNEASSSAYNSNIAAVNNSTLLPSIKTFVLPNKILVTQ